MSPDARLALPGIGKDLAAKIGELIQTGASSTTSSLLQEFPATISTCCGCRAIGPKTVARLYGELRVGRSTSSSRRRTTAASAG